MPLVRIVVPTNQTNSSANVDNLMLFQETPLAGAYVIDPERREDDRGFFARIYCAREFSELGLSTDLAQCNIAYNLTSGILRGMHFQKAPHQEVKLVRCTMGSVFDAIVDVRPESPTYRQWFGVELSAQNRRQLYVPKGFAHGYLTLEDNSELTYQVSEFYTPEAEAGLRWNDPAVGIEWPAIEIQDISEKDGRWPLLD